MSRFATEQVNEPRWSRNDQPLWDLPQGMHLASRALHRFQSEEPLSTVTKCPVATKKEVETCRNSKGSLMPPPKIYFFQSNDAFVCPCMQCRFFTSPPVVFSHCPLVRMPAAGCQPTRPPGQFLQPLALLQRHQHRQGGQRSRPLVPLLRQLRPQGGRRLGAVPVCGHLAGHRAGSGSHAATSWRTEATAACYPFTHR